jgi:hypothetical protein
MSHAKTFNVFKIYIGKLLNDDCTYIFNWSDKFSCLVSE